MKFYWITSQDRQSKSAKTENRLLYIIYKNYKAIRDI